MRTSIELSADLVIGLALLLQNKSGEEGEKGTEVKLADLLVKVEFLHGNGLKLEAAFVDLYRQLLVSKFIAD